jgi:hypothetical protein
MMISRWFPVGLSLSMAMLLAPGSAAAQKYDHGQRPDSAGIPADTVRLATHEVDLGECDVIGYRVVVDSAMVKHLWQYPQCKLADFGDVYGRTLVQIPLMGDCHSTFRIDAWRSEARREYRVHVIGYYGGCRAGLYEKRWLVLPKLPPGWRVAFSEGRGDERRGRGEAYLPALLGRVWLPQPGEEGSR